MAITIILSKDQFTTETCNGSVREHKILGFPKEKSPLQPYSSVLYWSYITSDVGCIVPERLHAGFEIVSYVIKGGLDLYNKEKDQWIKLSKGDTGTIEGKKGIGYSEKIYPQTEILQVWLDPNINKLLESDSVITPYNPKLYFPNNANERNISYLSGKDTPVNLSSKDVSIQMQELEPAFHKIHCPADTVLSGFVLEGFIEIDDRTLGKADFFKIEEQKEIIIASLTQSKIFMVVSPFIPKYQPIMQV
jgi:redox-sensitive bicupin YhaK (pirin superfamily)